MLAVGDGEAELIVHRAVVGQELEELVAEMDREKHLSSLDQRGACHSKRLQAAHPTRYQGEPVGETAELENYRVSLRNDDLAVDRAASFLRKRPPVGEEGEEIRCSDVAVERSKNPRSVRAGGVVFVTTRRGPVTDTAPS